MSRDEELARRLREIVASLHAAAMWPPVGTVIQPQLADAPTIAAPLSSVPLPPHNSWPVAPEECLTALRKYLATEINPRLIEMLLELCGDREVLFDATKGS